MLSSWDESNNRSISKRMIDRVRPEEALPKRIAAAQNSLKTRITKLDSISRNLTRHHDRIYQMMVLAYRSNKVGHARAYASELAQVRKTLKKLDRAKLSMMQVQIRLDTISEFGDVVVTLSPCMSIIRSLGPSLSGVVPQADESMQDLSQIIGTVMNASSVGGVDMLAAADAGAAGGDARAILEEAHDVMVKKAHSAIPDIPASIAGPLQGGTGGGMTGGAAPRAGAPGGALPETPAGNPVRRREREMI